MNIILACYLVGNIKLDRHIRTTGYVCVSYVSLGVINSYYIRSCIGESRNDGRNCRPIDIVIGIGIIAANRRIYNGRIEGSALCAGSHPLILSTVILGFTDVLTHPAPSSLVAAPIVSEYSTCGRRKLFYYLKVARFLYGSIGSYLINRSAVNEPCNGILCPTEAVCMECLGCIETKVIHILVTALAINEEVELNVSGIVAKELDIDLIVRIRIAILEIVRTCANKECACSTGICGRLHRNLVITVMIIVLSTSFARGVIEGNVLAVKPSRRCLFGYTKAHNAIFIMNVVSLPNNVENVAIGPALGLEEHVGISSVLKVDYLLCNESRIAQGYRGRYKILDKINRLIDECTACESHNHNQH